MVAYKEWGFQLYPGVAFEDLASRTEKLGGKARTRDVMQELRDTERDRVVEAEYGREAVDNVRAQEAAKLTVKEAKAAEEREDEELAGSRYMEVDEEDGGAPSSSSSSSAVAGEGGGGAGGGREDGGHGGGQTAAVLSEQARQRMEVNRRLALERLRLKKEEAAAAAAVAAAASVAAATAGHEGQAVGAGAGATALPVDDDDIDPKDLMDVDAGGGGGGADGDFEDDEAALAEMEADQATASTVKSPASDETPQAQTAAAPAAAAAGATLPIDDAQGVDPVSVTLAESTTRGGDTVNSEGNPGAGGVAAETAVAADHAPAPVSVVPGKTAGGPIDDATPAPAGATPEPDKPASGLSGEEKKGCADDGAEASRSEAGSSSTAGSAAEGSAVAGGGEAVGGGADGASEPTTATKGDGLESFSSPTKRKAAGGLPLSPLGNMLASTDVPAEGGSMAVRAPLGGLLSDENV